MTLRKELHQCERCIHFDPVPLNFSEWPCAVDHRPKKDQFLGWIKRGCKDFESKAMRGRQTTGGSAMRTFNVAWESEGNIEKGRVIVRATSLPEAQSKFLEWIKKRPLYQHMWQLSFKLEEVEYVEPEIIE